MMTALMEDFEVLSYTLWEKIKLIEKDNVSQDLLIQEKFEIDKFLWKLRAFSEENIRQQKLINILHNRSFLVL